MLPAAEKPTGGKGGASNRGGRGKGNRNGAGSSTASDIVSTPSATTGLLGDILWKQQKVGKQAQVTGASPDATL